MITVRGRELVIPKLEEQIGTTYDNHSEVRHIRVSRALSGGMDISRLQFKLDVEYANEVLDTCLLDAEVQTDYILLTWTIPESCVATKGTVWIAVRAYDENGTIKWATNKGAVYVGHTIFDGDGYKGKLTELEQLEERIRQRKETLDTNENERKTAEEQRETNEERRIHNEAEWQRQARTAIGTANETLGEARMQVENVTQKAVEAAGSATDAAGSAAIASQKEAIATQKAVEAAGSATDAAGSAAIASQKEAIATQKAVEAAGSATDAAGSAAIASQKEAIATQKAVEAAGSAQRAEQAAGCDGTAMSIYAADTHGLGSVTVQGQLDSLAASVQAQIFPIKTYPFNNSAITFERYNDEVIIGVYIAPSEVTYLEINILKRIPFTLPIGFRPIRTVLSRGIVSDASLEGAVIMIDNGGGIRLMSLYQIFTAGAGSIRLEACYRTKDPFPSLP